MDVRQILAEAFLSGLEDAQRQTIADRDALEQALAGAVASARGEWPTVCGDDARFAAYVARQLTADPDPAAALHELRWGDLYLAWACSTKDTAALAAFEEQVFPIAGAALTQMRLPATAVDEVMQVLREQLFVAPAGQRPMICGFSGRGQLRNWLRVVAVRTATRWIGRTDREVPLPDEALDHLVLAPEDAELQHLKEGYHAEFKASFLEALESLDSRERALLKHHYLDELNIDQIGALYRVHRATAARWLATARDTLLERTRDGLMRRLKVDRSECASIMRLIESRLGFTFRSLLNERRK